MINLYTFYSDLLEVNDNNMSYETLVGQIKLFTTLNNLDIDTMSSEGFVDFVKNLFKTFVDMIKRFFSWLKEVYRRIIGFFKKGDVENAVDATEYPFNLKYLNYDQEAIKSRSTEHTDKINKKRKDGKNFREHVVCINMLKSFLDAHDNTFDETRDRYSHELLFVSIIENIRARICESSDMMTILSENFDKIEEFKDPLDGNNILKETDHNIFKIKSDIGRNLEVVKNYIKYGKESDFRFQNVDNEDRNWVKQSGDKIVDGMRYRLKDIQYDDLGFIARDTDVDPPDLLRYSKYDQSDKEHYKNDRIKNFDWTAEHLKNFMLSTRNKILHIDYLSALILRVSIGVKSTRDFLKIYSKLCKDVTKIGKGDKKHIKRMLRETIDSMKTSSNSLDKSSTEITNGIFRLIQNIDNRKDNNRKSIHIIRRFLGKFAESLNYSTETINFVISNFTKAIDIVNKNHRDNKELENVYDIANKKVNGDIYRIDQESALLFKRRASKHLMKDWSKAIKAYRPEEETVVNYLHALWGIDFTRNCKKRVKYYILDDSKFQKLGDAYVGDVNADDTGTGRMRCYAYTWSSRSHELNKKTGYTDKKLNSYFILIDKSFYDIYRNGNKDHEMVFNSIVFHELTHNLYYRFIYRFYTGICEVLLKEINDDVLIKMLSDIYVSRKILTDDIYFKTYLSFCLTTSPIDGEHEAIKKRNELIHLLKKHAGILEIDERIVDEVVHKNEENKYEFLDNYRLKKKTDDDDDNFIYFSIELICDLNGAMSIGCDPREVNFNNISRLFFKNVDDKELSETMKHFKYNVNKKFQSFRDSIYERFGIFKTK